MGNAPSLAKRPDKRIALINHVGAAAHGISDGGIIRISSAAGDGEAPARVTGEVMPEVVSLPHGFGHARASVRLSVARARPGVSHNDGTLRTCIDVLPGSAGLVDTPITISPVDRDAFAVAASKTNG